MQNCSAKFKNDVKFRAYKFSLVTIKFLNAIPKNQISKTIADQLLRSATSIGANIIEAQAASSKREFQNFINYSLRSANETKYWLCLLRDAKIVTRDKVTPLLNEAVELSKILGASILKLKGRK